MNKLMHCKSNTMFRLLFIGSFLVVGLFTACTHLQLESITLTDFSKYPQTAAFCHFLNVQTNAFLHTQESDLLAITSFHRRDDVALCYLVKLNGYDYDVRSCYDWAEQADHEKQLSRADMKRLRVAIGELPATYATPPIERLLLVSFRQGTNWLTRSYDRMAAPEAMLKIYAIIEERFETAGPRY
jgi:hypothetical protein